MIVRSNIAKQADILQFVQAEIQSIEPKLPVPNCPALKWWHPNVLPQLLLLRLQSLVAYNSYSLTRTIHDGHRN